MRSLSLRACLAPLDRTVLAEMAGTLGLPRERDLIPSLCSALSNAELVSEIARTIPERARALLREVVYSAYNRLPPPGEKACRSEEFRLLNRHGLLHCGREYWGTIRLVVPEETAPLLLDVFLAEDIARLERCAKVEATEIVSHADRFLRNVTTLVSLADQEPIPVTARGEAAKVHVARRVLPFLEPMGVELTSDGRGPYWFHHVLEFCLLFGLLIRAEKGMQPGPCADAWFHTSETAASEALIHYASVMLPEIPVERATRTLCRAGSGWVPAADWKGLYLPSRAPRGKSREADRSWDEAFLLLAILGIVDGGRAGRVAVLAPGRLWRLENGDAAQHFLVTPDFKISAPRQLKSSLRRELSRIADFVKSDMMDQWELTASSVMRAIDEGLFADAIIDFLTRHSSVPLSSNVVSTINLWCRSHLTIRLFHGPVLVVEGDAEAESVARVLAEEGALVDRPSPRVFLVNPKKSDAVLRKLRQRRTVSRLAAPLKSETSEDFSAVVARLKSLRSEEEQSRAPLQIVSV